MDFEIKIIQFLQSGRSHFFDVSFQALTMLGSAMAVVLFSLFLLARKRSLTFWYLFSYGFVLLIVSILKSTIQRERPFVSSEEVELIGSISQDFSFPSGHTACAMAIAIFTGYALFGEYKKVGTRALIVLGLAIYVGLVGLSRMYLGAHYLTDVLAGAAISAIVCSIGLLIMRYVNKVFKEKKDETKNGY